MKKTLLALLTLAAAAASCQPKELADSASGLVREIPVTFTAEQPATRTFIEATPTGWTPKWQKGDLLTVTYLQDGDYTAQKEFTNSAEDGTTGVFSGTLELADGTHTIYAYYPSAMKDGRSEGIFKFALPSVQNIPSLTTFDPAADLLVSNGAEVVIESGALKSAQTLHFNRIFAVAKIVIADGTTGGKLAGKAIKSVTFKVSSGTLTGRASVDISTAKLTAWEGKSSYNYATASYSGSDWKADGSTGAFIVINPATFAAGVTVTAVVETDDSSINIERSVTLSEALAFESGKVNTLIFSIKDSDIEEDTGIEPTTWDFSEEAWQAAFAKIGTINSDITGWNLTLNNLTIVSTKKSKYNTTFFQWGGAGGTDDRYMTFTATTAGKLTVWASNTGSGEDPGRKVEVRAGSYSGTFAAGTSTNNAPTECTFKDVPAGEVKVYSSGNGLRFYKLEFTGEVKEAEPTPEPGPEDGGEQECTTPPPTGTVDPARMYGYAEAAGVKGGEGADALHTFHFNDGAALQTWLLAREKAEKSGDKSPVIIWLSGSFGPEDGRSGAFDVKRVSNLSFFGTDDFVMDKVGMFLVEAENIVIRNIHFNQPKYPVDAISMQECNMVWVDHCTFTSLDQTKDAEDGSCDATHGSKNITVSWCVFDKTQKSCLVGHSDKVNSDTANDPDITITFHHNWFAKSSSRHPRVRFGTAHAYNNFYDGCTTYGAGSASSAKVLVEYNYFDAVQLPTDIATYPAKENGNSNLTDGTAGFLYPTQNVYYNKPAKAKEPYPLCNVKYTTYHGATVTPLTYEDFKPDYEYTVTPVEDIPSVVTANAGYGKLSGFATAPIEVNNGGISGGGDTPDNPETPDTPDTPAAGLAEGWSWVNNNATANYAVTDGKLSIASTGKWESKAQGFGFVYREVSGDFTATVKLVSFTPQKAGSNQAVAGLMAIDGDVSATDAYLVYGIGGGNYYGNFRPAAGSDRSGFTLKAPTTSGTDVVIRMKREGNILKFSYSLDGGQTFGDASSKEFTSLSETIHVGLGVNSGDNSKQSTAVFGDFTINNTTIAF